MENLRARSNAPPTRESEAPETASWTPPQWIDAMEAERHALGEHPLATRLTTVDQLRVFCERHVFCVWDFMSLLKSLQHDLTCVAPVWTPSPDPGGARLINEIVLAEESDEMAPGVYRSHFAWYLEAMREVGANTNAIERVVTRVRAGDSALEALDDPMLPREVRDFSRSTFAYLDAPLEVRVAVFFYGRENLIPSLFVPFLTHLRDSGLPCSKLIGYFERHIEVDGDQHGPMARGLLEDLLARAPHLAAPAFEAARHSLAERRRLWDRTLVACQRTTSNAAAQSFRR